MSMSLFSQRPQSRGDFDTDHLQISQDLRLVFGPETQNIDHVPVNCQIA